MGNAKPVKENNSDHNHLQQFLHRIREGLLVVLFATAVFLLLSLITYQSSDPSWSHTGPSQTILNLGGKAGAWLSDFTFYMFGYMAYLFPAALIAMAWRIYRRDREGIPLEQYPILITKLVGFILVICSAAGTINLHLTTFWIQLPFTSGGVFGQVIGDHMLNWFNDAGATFLLIAVLLLGVSLLTGLSWFSLLEKIGALVLRGFQLIHHSEIKFKLNLPKLSLNLSWLGQFPFRKKTDALITEPVMSFDYKEEAHHIIPSAEEASPSQIGFSSLDIKDYTPSNTEELQDAIKKRSGKFQLPKLPLLSTPIATKVAQYTRAQLEEKSREVENCLKDFGVQATVEAVYPGPVVTRYEMELAAGTKVSKVTGLAKDLARSLSVSSVRVVEIISGKSVIGVELPNEKREMVTLREVLASKSYQQSNSSLSLALGKDISGHPITVDLAKMPHLLVAGTTGSGKSVSVNAMLLSMLYKASPDELRLIMIDPKMLELSVYDDIPHLLVPVVTDMKDAATALRWCVIEMERRYRLMATLGVRSIMGYNDKIKEGKQTGQPILDPLWQPAIGETPKPLDTLPQIVVVVDEFADLMMVVGKKVETLIARLAQKARAAGIHLILATQRPSVDVITGLIKANIPARIAFQVSSRIDSRTILDQQGAEQLLGHGDMLYLAPGSGLPKRIHGAFVDDDEVHRVTKFLKKNNATNYLEEILDPTVNRVDNNGYITTDSEEDAEKDEFYDEAVHMIAKNRRVSVSSVQRRFKIGYNRASRIVEAMEVAGVVSPMEQNGTREVLVPPPVES
ncbi:MAG: cell division protein FtsK [Gammaproteobacteria bacterium RIFCSPHIGHO2_12_FULL_41_15]|nr:MAG: cell division protein FtsK [Gammaproteobacteria bacterium RIFCSPHIGHO2_12_FULL_41_15]